MDLGHKYPISLLLFRENLLYSCFHFRLDLWSLRRNSPHLRDLTDLTEMMDREGCCRSAAMHKSSPLGPIQQNQTRTTWGRTRNVERTTLRCSLNFLIYESRSCLQITLAYKSARNSDKPHSSFSLGRISHILVYVWSDYPIFLLSRDS